MREVIADEPAAFAAYAAIRRDIKGFAGMTGTVHVLEHDKAVVAAGHPEPTPQRRQDCGAPRIFEIPIFAEIAIEVLVVPDFVLRDVAGQDGEHRIRAGTRQGPVIAGGTGLDNAS